MNIAATDSPDRAARAQTRRHAVQADRAVVELRRGRTVGIVDDNGSCMVAAIETIGAHDRIAMTDPVGMLRIVMAGDRLQALGLDAPGAIVAVPVPASVSPRAIRHLIGLEVGGVDLSGGAVRAAGALSQAVSRVFERSAADNEAPLELKALQPGMASVAEVAAFHLVKQTRLLPALLTRPLTGPLMGRDEDGIDRVVISSAAARDYALDRAHDLVRVSEAQVPLAIKEDCRFIVYRERAGDAEHVAILVGQPERHGPVPLRLHSSCLTGDLFGSLRCDCGEQLRSAVERIDEAGGGVLLYLSHEGRGIGLANKLRAYQLQVDGLDTLEADRYLGFTSDERNYSAACAMLDDLGIASVRLLTNNPGKMAALAAGGIEVVNRVPLMAAENPHNVRYMRAKREHAGHLGDDTAPANDGFGPVRAQR